MNMKMFKNARYIKYIQLDKLLHKTSSALKPYARSSQHGLVILCLRCWPTAHCWHGSVVSSLSTENYKHGRNLEHQKADPHLASINVRLELSIWHNASAVQRKLTQIAQQQKSVGVNPDNNTTLSLNSFCLLQRK